MADSETPYKLAIVASTCHYYQTPLFRQLGTHPRIDLTVYFCTKEGLYAEDVLAMYKTEEKWGIEEELLEGFNSKFLRNYSPRPSYLKWPFGLANFGIWREIRKTKPDAVVLMGWMNLTWWVAILVCLYSKIPFFYMTDANVEPELLRPRWKRWARNVLLGKLLFRFTSGFLCAGTANKNLYRHFGVAEEKLIPFAYSSGYDALLEASECLQPQKAQLRAEMGIPEGSFVVLFCGRLSQVKDPFCLLEAYGRINLPNKALIFVGDGPLKEPLLEHATSHNLDSVQFVGFQDRKQIPKFYAISNVLVLPSIRETWGIVVNEALCFGLPVIVSDQVGAIEDLVIQGRNGFTFPARDSEGLASRIQQLMELSLEKRSAMGAGSLELIKNWSQRDHGGSLVRYLDSISFRRARKHGGGSGECPC